FLASDPAAVRQHTTKVLYLDDGEIATVWREGCRTLTLRNEKVTKPVEEIPWDLANVEKAGHGHFMHKEIFEQPDAIRNALRGRLLVDDGDAHLGGLNLSREELRGIDRLIITACGTSYYAAMIGEYMIEEKARIPVEIEYASEFRYRDPI